MYIWILLILAAFIMTLVISYITFRMGFYAPRKEEQNGAVELPEGEIYEPFWPAMEAWIRETRATPHEVLEIRSFDGLRLRGKYYEYAPPERPLRSCSTVIVAALSGICAAVCSVPSPWATAR